MNIASILPQAYLNEKKPKEYSQKFFDWYMGTICIITQPSIKTREIIAIILALRTVEHLAAFSTESNRGSEATVVLNPFGVFGPVNDFQRSTNGLQIRWGDECLVLVCNYNVFDSH